MMIYFDETDLLIGMAILFAALPFLWWKKRNLSYLLFFSIFWLYLLSVVSVVVFPVAINTDYAGTFRPSINLIPFYFGDCQLPELCIRSIIENIIFTVPFGFGINFLVEIKPKYIFWLAFVVGFVFEFSQLIISLAFRSGFRSTDINDVILNGAGVLVGYVLFRLFAWLYLKITEHFNFKHRLIFADIYEVALQTQVAGRSKNA
ncbi:MAG: VanZ family protein [Chloroflexi bacterium]|nr:VanZ family protein [Chloroflexota bacterium]MBI3338842.1 VanZ family protein [Chloroflexota bacterium]